MTCLLGDVWWFYAGICLATVWLVGLSCTMMLCSFTNQVLVQLYLFSNFNINTLDHVKMNAAFVGNTGHSQRDRLGWLRRLEVRKSSTSSLRNSSHLPKISTQYKT